MVHATSSEGARAMDLIRASGVLNPNVTLDKLMVVTRQLSELEPNTGATTDAGPIGLATLTVFVGAFYCYKQVVR